MPINTFKEDESTRQVLKIHTLLRLFAYMLKYRKEILQVLGLMLVVIAVGTVNPLLLKVSIDDKIAKGDVPGLLGILLLALLLNGISMLCVRERILRMSRVSNLVLMEIRQELYVHIQRLSFNFFDNRPVGKILSRVIGDVNSLKDILTNSVVTLLPDLATVVVVLGVMLALNYRLAVAALAMLPFLVLGMANVEIRAHKKWQTFRQKNSNLSAFTHEDFSGIRVVQGYTAEEKTSRTFGVLQQEVKDSFIAASRLNDLFWPMVEISWGVGTILVFVLGVGMLDSGEVTVGLLVAFTTYIAMFWQPIMNLSNFYNQLVTNLAGAERIFEILDLKPDLQDGPEAEELPEIRGEVEFEGVDFSYDGREQVLEEVHFHVRPGETVALVGPTGAGKTTIVNLIGRFYDVDKGTIRIDGRDIRTVTMESLRRQMGIMTQDNFLFSGTVEENIRYGKLDATREEVEEAAKAVHAHGFIQELPQGYGTLVNERGTGLSGGQRQLIAFARTMIARPRLLVLDEATSSIDTSTERMVQEGIARLLEGRTAFVVAHRLSTIQKAHRILFVDGKNILEDGSHRELMDRQGRYYDLYMSQFKWM
ncbi:ABC transporter ATP-binding protein [Anaerotalea alkaliphila]|uniref:ABC transporter ATP-binding protein n=1 Tax=Anaerotalea alkaliphila TaxID=2662126 RepID=A0A7X5KMH1_9FIRM|nr:ABC transporter ATP-binding protein [Anaerotalea alkaliphila]NDL66723.1 ABC transporter ATP-binding protein [Anaerotalea alkaliphila]